MVFVPMTWETLGGWHEETVEQVKKLASAQARQTGEDRSEAIRHRYQKLSVLLTRGYAALLLNRHYPSQVTTFKTHQVGVEVSERGQMTSSFFCSENKGILFC